MARPRNDNFTKDLFYFQRYDPGKTTPVWTLNFEAHINDISDVSSPSWNDYFDMGRADPTVMYQSMNRTLNISFKLIATNKEEQENNHEEILAKLGKMTYPIYQSGLGYNASHVYFKISNLYAGYGIITNIGYNWNGDVPWIDGRPIYTDVSVGIRILGDSQGRRPSVKSNYFN